MIGIDDECNAYLNEQSGFDLQTIKHIEEIKINYSM